MLLYNLFIPNEWYKQEFFFPSLCGIKDGDDGGNYSKNDDEDLSRVYGGHLDRSNKKEFWEICPRKIILRTMVKL